MSMSELSRDLIELGRIDHVEQYKIHKIAEVFDESKDVNRVWFLWHGDDDIRRRIARFPWEDGRMFDEIFMFIEEFKGKYKDTENPEFLWLAQDTLFYLALNPRMDPDRLTFYVQHGTKEQQLTCLECNAASDRLTDEHWAALAASEYEEVRRTVSRRYPYLPLPVREILDRDDDYVVAYNIEHAKKKAGIA